MNISYPADKVLRAIETVRADRTEAFYKKSGAYQHSVEGHLRKLHRVAQLCALQGLTMRLDYDDLVVLELLPAQLKDIELNKDP